MRKIILMLVMVAFLSTAAYAQLGNILKNIQDSPLLTEKNAMQGIIDRFLNIKSGLAKMKLNQGKLDLLIAALPLLDEAKILSSDILGVFQQKNTLDTAQTDKMGGILGQIEELISSKWSTSSLKPELIQELKDKTQQVNQLITDTLKNSRDTFKAILENIKGR